MLKKKVPDRSSHSWEAISLLLQSHEALHNPSEFLIRTEMLPRWYKEAGNNACCAVMLLLKLLFTLISALIRAKPVCRLQGNPLVPELAGHGDLIIGGIFTFRTGYDGEIPTFQSLPNEPNCKK